MWVLAVDLGAVPVRAAVKEDDQIELLELAAVPVLSPAEDEEPVPSVQVYAELLTAVAAEAPHDRTPATPDGLILTFHTESQESQLRVLRAAARAAGLPVPGLVAEAVAVACHLAAGVGSGQHVAVLDVEHDGVHAVVVRRTEFSGFELTVPPGRIVVGSGEAATKLPPLLSASGVAPQQLAAVCTLGLTSAARDVIGEIAGIHPAPAPGPAAVLGAFAAVGLSASATNLSRATVAPQAILPPDSGQTRWPQRMPGRWTAAITGAAALAVILAIVFATVGSGGPSRSHRPQPPRTGALASGTALSTAPDIAWVLTTGVATATATLLPINTTTGAAGEPIPVGSTQGRPMAIAITPDGKTVVTATIGPNYAGGAVSIVDTATATARPPIIIGTTPEAVAITPDGKTAYVLSYATTSAGFVTPVSIATGTAGTPIPVGQVPVAIAIAPDGRTAFVASDGSGQGGAVTPIDIATNTAGPAIAVGPNPAAVAFTPNNKTAYVVNSGNGAGEPGSVTPISAATDNAGAAIAAGSQLSEIAITPNGQFAYVAGVGGSTVTPIDIATGQASPPIHLGGHAGGLVMSPDGRVLYVIKDVQTYRPTATTIWPISTAKGQVGTAITVPIAGAEPRSAVMTPDGKTLYLIGYDAASASSGTVVAVNTGTGTVGRPIAVSDGMPVAIAITPVGVHLTRPLSPPAVAAQGAGVPLLEETGIGTQGCGTVRPAYIYGGGDASDQVTDIRWQSWGSQMAMGTGKALWVTTTVAAAKLEPVRLIAFNLGQLNGRYAYRSLDVFFPQHGQAFNPSVPSFGC